MTMSRHITKVKVWDAKGASTTYVFLESLGTSNDVPKESTTLKHIPHGTINYDDTVNMVRKKLCHFIDGFKSPNDIYCWVQEKAVHDPSVMHAFIANVFGKQNTVKKEVIHAQFWNMFGIDIQEYLSTYDSIIDKRTATRVLFQVPLTDVKHLSRSIAFQYARDTFLEYFSQHPLHAKDTFHVGTLELVPTLNLLLSSFDISQDTLHIIHRSQLDDVYHDIYFPFHGQTKLDKDDVKLITNMLEIEQELKAIEVPTHTTSHKTFINYVHIRGNEYNHGVRENLDVLFNAFETHADIPFIKLKTPTNVFYKIHKGSLAVIRRDLFDAWTKTPFVKEDKTYIVVKIKFHTTYCTLTLHSDLSTSIKMSISIRDKQTLRDVEKVIPRINAFLDIVERTYDTAYVARVPKDILVNSKDGDVYRVVQIISSSVSNVTSMKVHYDMFKPLLQNKLYPYFGIIETKDPTILHLQYKKVNNYSKYTNIETFITLNKSLSHDELVQNIVSTFLIPSADAEKAIAAWEAVHTTLDEKRQYVSIFNKDTMFVNVKIKINNPIEFKYLVNGAPNMSVVSSIHMLLMKLLVLSETKKKMTMKSKADELFEKAVHEQHIDVNKEEENNNSAFANDLDSSPGGTDTLDTEFMDDDLLALEREFAEAFEATKEKDVMESPSMNQNDNMNTNTTASQDTIHDTIVDYKEKGEVNLKGYLLNKLKEADQQLFQYDLPPDKKRKDYPTLCGKSVMRQPVVVTKSELTKIQEEFPEAVKEYVKSGSTPEHEKRNHYICPKIWCPKSRVALSFEDYVKHGRKCPYPEIAEEPILFQSKQYFGEGDAGLQRDRHPGFLEKTIHPDQFCLPCCFKLEAKEGTRNKSRKEKCVPKFTEDIEGPEEYTNTKKNPSLPNAQKEVIDKVESRPEEGPIDKYILNEHTSPLDENRFGVLPTTLVTFLNQADKQGSRHDGTGSMKATTHALFRKGIRQSSNSFLDAVANVIENEAIYSGDGIIKAILEHLDIFTYISLENGRVMKMFIDASKPIFDIDHFREFYEWFKQQRKYITHMNLGGLLLEMEQLKDVTKELRFNQELLQHHQDILREYILYHSFMNFKAYIANTRVTKEHIVLLDLVANKLQHVINIHRYNIIVIDYIPESNKMYVHCNVNTATTYDPNYPYVLILKRNNYYEPIYNVINREGGGVEQSPLLILKESTPEVRKMLTFFTKNCKKAEISYVRSMKEFLATQGFSVKYFVLDYGYKTCGFIVQKNLFIPLPSRFDMYYEPGIKYIYLSTVPSFRCFLKQDSIRPLFTKLNELTGTSFYEITASIVQKNRLIGLVIRGDDATQNTFIPLHVKNEDKRVTLAFKNGLYVLIGYQDEDMRVEQMQEKFKGWDKITQIAEELRKVMEEHDDVRNELRFIVDRMNPLPIAYKREKLAQVIAPYVDTEKWGELSALDIYRMMKYMEDTKKYDIYMLRSKRYNHTEDELFIDHFDVRNGKLEEAIILAENPFKALMNISEEFEQTYIFDDDTTIDKVEDTSDLLMTKDVYKDVPVKWRKVMLGFKTIDNTEVYTADFLLQTMLRLSKGNPRSALTLTLYQAALQNAIAKDYERGDISELIANPWTKAYLKQKNAKDYDTIMEGVNSIHYYPSTYDLEIMSKLAHINVIVLGRKTEKNPDGFEVIYRGSTYFIIFLFAYDRFKVIDRFSLIADIKAKRVLFTQEDLPVVFLEKIRDKLIVRNVEVDDS